MNRLPVLLDPLFVAVFVTVGRRAHDETGAFGDFARTAAPFFVALAAGWIAARVWRDPAGLRTGAIVAIVTIAGGIGLRRVAFGDGIAFAFIAVATSFLAVTLLGWRTAALRFAARRQATGRFGA